MDLKEYVLPKNSMIGGWYIPAAICDDLITLFKESEEYQQPGVVGPPARIDPDEKRSTEVPINPSYDHPTFIIYKNLIGNIIHLYEKNILKLKNLVNLEWGNLVRFSIISPEKDLKNGILKEAVEQKIVV